MGDTVMMQKRQRQKKFVGGIIKKGVQKIIKKVTDKVKKPKKPKTGVTTKGPANPGARSRRGGVTSTTRTTRVNPGARTRRGGNISNIGKTAFIPPAMMGALIEKKPKDKKPVKSKKLPDARDKAKNRTQVKPGKFVTFKNPQKSGFVRDSKGNKIRYGKDTEAYKKRMKDRKGGGGK